MFAGSAVEERPGVEGGVGPVRPGDSPGHGQSDRRDTQESTPGTGHARTCKQQESLPEEPPTPPPRSREESSVTQKAGRTQSVSRSISREEQRSESQESSESSGSLKQIRKPRPSVQKTYFSKLVSIQKQPDQKPLIKRTPSDTDRGRRELVTPKSKQKGVKGGPNTKTEDTPSYVKVKAPGKIRAEAKSWLEDELNRLQKKDQSAKEGGDTCKLVETKQITFHYTDGGVKEAVELAGSFTEWGRVALAREEEGDVWSVSLAVAPGTHTYKYLVDGAWRTHSGVPTSVDSEGNVNNVVEVAEDFNPTSSSSPLAHPTTERPKAPGRRPPSTKFLRKGLDVSAVPEEEAVVGRMELQLSPVQARVVDLSHLQKVPPSPKGLSESGPQVSTQQVPEKATPGGDAISRVGEGVLPVQSAAEGASTGGAGKDTQNGAETTGSKAEVSCADAGMGNTKSVAKGTTPDTEVINTVNENVKKICLDPRYQSNSKTQVLIGEVLNQVGFI